MVIAIDGPGGVGKSTVSSHVAAALDLPHLDTGSTYRAAGLMALRSGADVGDAGAVVEAIRGAHITIELGVVSVDGVEVTQELRGDVVTAASSAVATPPRGAGRHRGTAASLGCRTRRLGRRGRT